MREIKFRAKVKNEDGIIELKIVSRLTMFSGGGLYYAYCENDDYEYRLDPSDFLAVSVLQAGELHQIYEGDIIKYHYFYFADGSEIEKEHVCSVKYDDSFANFDAMDKEGFAHFLGNASDDGIEVIGNIYENPELLK